MKGFCSRTHADELLFDFSPEPRDRISDIEYMQDASDIRKVNADLISL